MGPCLALGQRARALAFAAALSLLALPALAEPTAPVALAQQNADSSSLADGGVTSEGREIQLGASSPSLDCYYSPYHLEFEVRPTTQAFSYVPTHYSGDLNKNNQCTQQAYPWTRITGLAEGVTYKWQVRTVNLYGWQTSWVAYNGGGAAFTTSAAPANHLQFTTASLAPVAGTCAGPSTVQLQNGGGGAVNVGASTPVPLFQSTDVQPSVSFYSDATCDAGVSSGTMAAGTSTTSFYWRTTRSGAVNVGADEQNALWALQSHTVNPGPITQLQFIDPNNTTYVTQCSYVRTVQLKDTYGNPSPALSTTAVALTSGSSGGITFYSDSTCTVPITQVQIAAGANQASFYYKDNYAEGVYLYATVTGLPVASQYTYNYGRTWVISAAQTRDAGQCSGVTTVQTQNLSGVAYNVPTATTVWLYGSTGMNFYSESTCDAGISQYVMDAGTNAFNFYWRSTAASPPYSPSGSSVYLYGSANWMFAYSQNQTVNPGPPNKLGFGSTAQTVVAGACSAVTVARSLDVYGNYSPPTAALAVSLSTSSSGGRFYSDAACTTQITSVSIAAGALSANFYWKDTTPGSPTLTLSNTSPGLTAATQVETVLPKLVFTSAAQNLVAGQCSAPTTVQSQDGNAAGWNTSTSKTINLSTTSPAGPFFSDPACTVSISTVTMAAGTNAVTFYWKDTKAGSPTLTATATGYASGSQTQTIRPDVPALLNFTTAAQTVGAGLCSAVTTVEQEDTYGNAATQATSRSVSLLSTSATTRFYSDSACTAQITSVTIGASPATAASFYWKDAVAPQALTLTARSGGLLDGTQNETVSVGAATRLALTSAAKTVTAGACSGSATVGSQDASGNASNVGTATLVTLASSTGTTVFYAGGTCAGAPVTAVTIAAATSSATFSWVETTAGSLTLTPSATGFTGTGQAQTVTAGTGTKLNITTAAQSVPAGSCSAATTVAVEDSYGNAAPVGAAITVALTATSGTFGFYSDSSCTAVVTSVGIGAGSSSATFYWQDLSTGSVTITTSSSPLIADTQLESIGGRDQVAYRWYSSAGAALGAESTAVQIAPGTQVHLRVGIKAVTFAWKLSSGDAAPTGETFANAETHTGSYLSLAAADGSSETLVETRVGKGPTAYRALGDTGAAGYPFHVYAFSSLPSGKTTYPLCLTASTTGEALQVGYAFTSTPSLTPTFPAGWQLTSTTLTEVCFDLKAQGFNGGPLTVYLQDAIRGAGTDGTTDTFTLDRVAVKGDPPTYLALERASNSSFTGATQVLSAELWDDAAYANGAVVSPVLSGTSANEVRVESRPSLPASQVDVNPGGQGEWDFALAFPSGGGTQYYRMVVTDSLGTRLGALEVTTTPARADTAATKLAFTTAAFTVPAGACSGPLKVQAQDPAGNARLQTSARTVTLTSSATSGRFYSDASCTAQITSTTIAVGQSDAAFYWRDTAVGPSVVTAASAGLTSATQTENVNPGPPSAVAFTTASQNVTVGACSAAASVQVRDAYGNASPVGAATSGPLSSTSGTTRFYSDAACTAQITSLTVAAGLANASFYFLDTAAGSPTITYAPPGLTAASQVETFSVGLPTRLAITTAPLVVVAGQCSGAVLPGGSVVQAQDSFGNPANVTANITVALSSVSSTLVFYADAACAVAVTSRTITAPANTTTFYFRDTTASGTAVTATAAGLAAASQSETVSPAPPSALAISSAAQSVVAGACSAAVAVRTQDTYGNPSSVSSATSLPLTSSDAPVMRFYSDAACATPISSATVPVGLTSTQFFFKDTLAGGPVITVSGPGFSSATQAQTIRPAPTQGLAMSGFPSPSTAGVAGSFTLAAVDAYGNTAQDYAGSVQFSSSDARATLPPVTSFSPGTGLRTFSATLITAGTQSLTAVDNGVPPLSASQAGISVAAAAASALQPSGVPSPILPGTSHDVTVGAVDPFGNRATGYLGTVRFSSDDAAATLPANYAFTAGDQGRHTFTGGVKLQTVGTHQITVTDTVTGSVTGQQANIVVLQAQGGFCAGDGECSTGYCVGAVCCDTSCAGACNSCVLPGRVGTCSLVADGTSCTNGVYCDGAETCRTGTCTAGTPVACVDPSGYDQLGCDEPTRACVLVPNAPAVIVRDAALTGAPGIPYAYNAWGRITALGARPMTFGACTAIPGFLVDRLTGSVSWTPQAAGTYSACVSVQNQYGQDQYTFQVAVAAPSGGPPVAAFTVTPDTGPAPLSAAFDGAASTGVLPLAWRWDYGDFSTLGAGVQASSTYLLAGGYQAELTAFDAAGRPSSVKHPLWVTDKGRKPPAARITASSTLGDGSLTATFGCDCQIGDAPLRGYLWELGDLGVATTSGPSATFPPGRYHVRLTVLDGNGLTATDSVEVTVTKGGLQPPHCRIGLSPPAGPAPLAVQHRATFGDDDGTVITSAFTFSDGATAAEAEPARTYAQPGRYRTTLKVADDNGLTCEDQVQVAVIGAGGQPPPGFVSAGAATASCGVPYQYSETGRPLVSGAGPFQFDLVPVPGLALPAGMSVDSNTGAINWTPSSRNAGVSRVVLRATSPDGVAEQPLDITVTCAETTTTSVGCTCSQAGGASWIALVAGLALLARARRRQWRRGRAG